MRDDIGEVVLGEIVNERGLEGGVEATERAALRFAGEDGAGAAAGGIGEPGEFFDEFRGGGDDFAVTEREGGRPLVAPVLEAGGFARPAEFCGEGAVSVANAITTRMTSV